MGSPEVSNSVFYLGRAADVDEFSGMVVVAANDKLAREMANFAAGSEGYAWDSEKTVCRMIAAPAAEGIEGVVLASRDLPGKPYGIPGKCNALFLLKRADSPAAEEVTGIVVAAANENAARVLANKSFKEDDAETCLWTDGEIVTCECIASSVGGGLEGVLLSTREEM